MLRYTLIYLWIYTGIHGTVEVAAGDADEHVHIKLHMPKTAVRKSMHRNHVRHKKNPPPYVPSSPHGHGESVSGPGAAMHSQHTVYHEEPHNNYLTGMGATQSLHGLHHHMKKPLSPTMSVTHLQPIGGKGNSGSQQQLLDAQFYASADGTGSTGPAEFGGLMGDSSGGDYMAYLTKNFASFPQPTFETEIISSPMVNSDLTYQHARVKEEERDYRTQHQQHYATAFKHPHRQPYEMAAASVVGAGNHELDEDNEILGPLGRTSSSSMEQSEWLPQYQSPAKVYRGGLSSSVKALKNEHLLRHAMQQQQRRLYPNMENSQNIQSAPIQRSRNHYRDDKLYKETLENARDDAMQVMNTYLDMDAVAHRADDDDDAAGRHRNMAVGNDGAIKPLTVDDIWSQLQRTYLNKYTPQAQPNKMAEEQETTSSTPSRKQKRNSQKNKTRKRNYHHSQAATPTTPAATATAASVRTLSYENNYYNQEHQGKPSTFYDSHTPQSSSYGSSYASLSPFSTSYSSSSYPSPTERDFYNTRVTSSTRPSYQNFKTFSNFEGGADEEDNNEDDDGSFASNDDDVSSEESVFSSNHKKYGNNRSHRHNHGSVAYGHADTLNNNPFNYHDLYASYSTPIAQATIATLPNFQASTYHPNSYNIVAPTPSSSSPSSSSLLSASLNPQISHQQQVQAIYPTGHESTSYQWREQQHYPVSYQSYHTSSTHQQHQQQQKPQQQPHPNTQQYQPHTSSALRLPKATVASTSSASLSHNHPLAAGPSSSSSSSSSLSSSPLSPILSTNDFSSAVKQLSISQQQRNKKRKNRLKSKRNRIVVI